MDLLLLTFVVIGFLAVVLLFEGGYLLWSSNRGAEAVRIQRRLQVLSAGSRVSADSDIVRERLLAQSPPIERILGRIPRVRSVDRMLLQSGMRITVAQYLAWSGCVAFLGLLLWMVLRLPLWAAPLVSAAAGSLPSIYILRARRLRLRCIEQQLPDALELMSRALRAGHAFTSAMQMVGTEGPEPMAGEFRMAFDEVNYGVSLQDALTNLAVRVPITDLRFFVIAVAIQRETGGNLAELLDTLAGLIRARFKLMGTIRVLSSEGRLSGWILSLLPFFLVAAINAINPRFMSLLWTDQAGIKVMWTGSVLMVLGIVWMWRIVRIRV